MSTNPNPATPEVDEAEQYWDERYRTRPGWGDRANPLLVETAQPLEPGVALDLGCGPGGDTLWLAGRGWRVTAVDISGNAVGQVGARAAELGLADRVRPERHDLDRTFPEGEFDLVSAQYLHTYFALARGRVLRTAAHALRPGGLLLVVDHGSIAPWSSVQDPDHHHPTPDEMAAEIDLDPAGWTVLRADMPRREALGPDGETATVADNVLLIRRA